MTELSWLFCKSTPEWCEGAVVGSIASGLRRRRPVLQKPLLPSVTIGAWTPCSCDLQAGTSPALCFCLLWPPLEEETSNITGVKVTSESPWEQWCSGSRSSPSKNHSETNRHWGIKVSPWRTATKKLQLMSQGSPDPWLFFPENPFESGKRTRHEADKFCAIQVVVTSWGVAWRPECSGQRF